MHFNLENITILLYSKYYICLTVSIWTDIFFTLFSKKEPLWWLKKVIDVPQWDPPLLSVRLSESRIISNFLLWLPQWSNAGLLTWTTPEEFLSQSFGRFWQLSKCPRMTLKEYYKVLRWKAKHNVLRYRRWYSQRWRPILCYLWWSLLLCRVQKTWGGSWRHQ